MALPSHDYLYTFAVVAAVDQAVFHDDDFYTYVADYVAHAPPGSNTAAGKPRSHGAVHTRNGALLPNRLSR